MEISWDEDPAARLSRSTRSFGEYGGVNHSVEVSTTFTVMAASTLTDIFQGRRGSDQPEGGCFLYARALSPSVVDLSKQVAALEGTEAAYCTASGMSAIMAALLAICDSGDHIVASNAVYGGTFALLKSFLPRKCGINVTFVDITDSQAVAQAFGPRTKVLYTETLSNPTLRVADLPALSELAHARGCQLVVDNTFAPLVVSPARWGADVVVHSLTKFISGASDVMAGVACGTRAFVSSLIDLHTGPVMLLGPTLDPQTASLLSRRLANLPLRMAEHSRRALAMAELLRSLGADVIYPGLSSHRDHALMCRLMNASYGFSGVIGLDMKTNERASQLIEMLQNEYRFGLMAVSLGYFDTLMSISGVTTSSELAGEELEAAGVSPGLLRLSVGYTGTLEQRLAQLQDAYLKIVQQIPAGHRAATLSTPWDCPLPMALAPSESHDNSVASSFESQPAVPDAMAAAGIHGAICHAVDSIPTRPGLKRKTDM